MKRTAVTAWIALGAISLSQALIVESAIAGPGGRGGSDIVVYVTGQGLDYDSLLAAE